MHSFGYILPSSPFQPTLPKKANLPLPGNELSGSEEVRFHSDFVCFWNFDSWGWLRSFKFSEPPSNYRTGGGLTGISLRAAVQARMVLALAEGPGLVCTGVGPWVVTCPPWCCGIGLVWIPNSFSDIGGFKVCLNFVPIDTIFIIHVIDAITQSRTLFDGMACVSVNWTELKIVETRRPGEWSLGREMAFQVRRMENR